MNQTPNLAVTVIAKQFNGTGNVLLTLAPDNGILLPVFTPGAHIDVFLPDGSARQYSLCSVVGSAHYQICVRLDQASRGGSHWLYHDVKMGSILSISAPRNHFPLPEAERTLLFAAGIGLTPLLVMAEALLEQHADFTLHLFLKHQDERAFSSRLAQLGPRLVLHYSSEGDSLRNSVPDDLMRPENSVLVSCGPAGFMTHLQLIAGQYGWQSSQCFSEKFKPASTPPVTDSDTFTVEIASTRTRYTIREDETIAAVLGREGIDISLSCEQGMCGACITAVLQGEPDHRDEVLSEQERAANNCIVLCCSRSRSPLLLLDL